MSGVQAVIVTGHLAADPELRYTAAGNSIAKVRIPTSETWRNSRTGETEEHTEWHRVKVFGQPAEFAGKYLRKGALVTVIGKLRTEKWQHADGGDRYLTWLYADSVDGHGGGTRSDIEPRGDRTERHAPPAPPIDHSGAGDTDDAPF